MAEFSVLANQKQLKWNTLECRQVRDWKLVTCGMLGIRWRRGMGAWESWVQKDQILVAQSHLHHRQVLHSLLLQLSAEIPNLPSSEWSFCPSAPLTPLYCPALMPCWTVSAFLTLSFWFSARRNLSFIPSCCSSSVGHLNLLLLSSSGFL